MKNYVKKNKTKLVLKNKLQLSKVWNCNVSYLLPSIKIQGFKHVNTY